MRKVKIPTSMNPFVVHVNGEKYVYPAGTEQEVTDAVANVIDAYIKKENQQPDPTESPFSTSWNDLKDKPFGEETKMVGGDTTELAIDSTGMEPSVVLGNMKFFYLSDAVVTIDDLANGYTVRFTNAQGEKKEISCTADEVGALEQGKDKAIGIWDLRFICVAEDSYEASSEGPLVFPKKGIYLYGQMSVKGLPPVSLTIPGYKGFVSEQTVVKPLAEQYMPTLTSPSGKKFKLSVDDSGVLSATEV